MTRCLVGPVRWVLFGNELKRNLCPMTIDDRRDGLPSCRGQLTQAKALPDIPHLCNVIFTGLNDLNIQKTAGWMFPQLLFQKLTVAQRFLVPVPGADVNVPVVPKGRVIEHGAPVIRWDTEALMDLSRIAKAGVHADHPGGHEGAHAILIQIGGDIIMDMNKCPQLLAALLAR